MVKKYLNYTNFNTSKLLKYQIKNPLPFFIEKASKSTSFKLYEHDIPIIYKRNSSLLSSNNLSLFVARNVLLYTLYTMYKVYNFGMFPNQRLECSSWLANNMFVKKIMKPNARDR